MRMKLYFGNAITTATTLMLFALLGFIGWSVWGRTSIQYWGRRSTVLDVVIARTCDMLLCGDYEEAGRHRSQNQQKRRIID
ncbi:MAG: hypothetical protein V8Q05_07620 [Lachnospiraceae bacterium]